MVTYDATDDSAPIQAAIDCALAVATGQKPIVKLIGNYSHASSLYTNTATGIVTWGLTRH